jgi:DNA-directed RNA polymerase subunit H (RpoH/RPB5)
MKVFSKEQFIKAEGYNDYLESRIWVDECDGKIVRHGFCGEYVADDAWCINVPDDVSNHPRYKIVIEGFERTTLATMYVDDKVIKRTAAKRHPADKFNWRIGAQTAFDRLWEKKKKPVVLEVKRRAKPGEWVKIINATRDSANEYENGDVLQIVRYTGDTLQEYIYYRNKPTKFLYDDEYVVLEGYKPE